MSVTYVTLSVLKARLSIPSTDTDNDTYLTGVIEAVSRVIDDFAGQHIYADSEDTARYYTAQRSDICYIDNLVSITSLETDPTGDRTYTDTWAATDYDLQPDNPIDAPYQWIVTTPNGGYVFPTFGRGVKVTGKFGWSASIPQQVREACILMAEQVWLRKDIPFGVSGGDGAMLSASLQSIMFNDPHIKGLLARYRRYS
jgi:hypothetical protein